MELESDPQIVGSVNNESIWMETMDRIIPNPQSSNQELFQTTSAIFIILVLICNGYIIGFIYKQISKVKSVQRIQVKERFGEFCNNAYFNTKS